MSKMGHVLAVPEQTIVVCNGCMIHIMKPLDVSSMLNPKFKVQFGKFWTQIEQTRHYEKLKDRNVKIARFFFYLSSFAPDPSWNY